MAYGYFKNFLRETVSDITLSDKAFNNAENAKYDGYKRGLGLMIG